jgi:hypothetical protein
VLLRVALAPLSLACGFVVTLLLARGGTTIALLLGRERHALGKDASPASSRSPIPGRLHLLQSRLGNSFACAIHGDGTSMHGEAFNAISRINDLIWHGWGGIFPHMENS